MLLRLFTIETCKTGKHSSLRFGRVGLLLLFGMFTLIGHRHTTNGPGYTQFIDILLTSIFYGAG